VKVVMRIGYKGTAFVVLGVMFIILGAANIGGPKPSPTAMENMKVLLELMPIEGWYTAWILAGLCAITAAFMPRMESLAAGLTSAIPITTSVCYFFTAVLGLGYRAWATGLLYSLIAVLVGVVAVWPDPIRLLEMSPTEEAPVTKVEAKK
jgi:hypothetical protein